MNSETKLSEISGPAINRQPCASRCGRSVLLSSAGVCQPEGRAIPSGLRSPSSHSDGGCGFLGIILRFKTNHCRKLPADHVRHIESHIDAGGGYCLCNPIAQIPVYRAATTDPSRIE